MESPHLWSSQQVSTESISDGLVLIAFDVSLHHSNYSVSVPTLDDMDPDTNPTREEQDSMRAFCGLCRLTLILE